MQSYLLKYYVLHTVHLSMNVDIYQTSAQNGVHGLLLSVFSMNCKFVFECNNSPSSTLFLRQSRTFLGLADCTAFV